MGKNTLVPTTWMLLAMTFAFFPSAIVAQQHEITYDRIVFENDNQAGDLAWSQLVFTIEGFLIDGLCYHSCDIEFSLDGSPSGPNGDRADLRITRALVTSDFPTHSHGQMFIGYRQHRASEIDAIRAFRNREKLALAWIAEYSSELIAFALASERVSDDVRVYWTGQVDEFEVRLSSVFRTVLSGYRNQIRTRNTVDQTRDVIQPALAEIGLYSGSTDGISGRMTRRGIRAFQQQLGRLVTGYADGEELEMLAQISGPETQEDDGAPLSHTERLAQSLGIDLGEGETEEGVALEASAEVTRLRSELARSEASLQQARDLAADRLQIIRTLGTELREARLAHTSVGPDADSESEAVAAFRRQLEAANETIADLREHSVPRADYDRLEESATTMVQAEELRDAERRLAAANETIADMRESSVPAPEHAELRRQLDAANETIADLREGSVPRAEFLQLEARLATMVPTSDLQDAERRLVAANETIADMHDSMVPIAEAAELARQLEAANGAIANLRQTRVPMEDHISLRRQLEAANQTVADLRTDIEQNYVDRREAEVREDTLSRQINALNQTILELTEERDRQRVLRQQTEQIYQNWIDDCRSQAACANAMQLD